MAAKKTMPSKLPDRLWKVPVYLPYLQPPLTDAIVKQAESQLGVRLPRAYLDALRIQNGGSLRLDSHPSDHAPVD
jgi:cell wall assembly regulator SMI1